MATTRRPLEGRPILTRPSGGGIRFRFFGEVVSELKKVVWPTREEATRLTIMVVFVAVAVGVLLGLLDIGFSAIVRELFIG